MRNHKTQSQAEHIFIWLLASLMLLIITGNAEARNALEPVDTSSPRATLESFLVLIDESSRLYVEYRNSPNPATQNTLWYHSEKATAVIDLSQVPPTARREVGVETFLLLWDVIARLELPELQEIPDVSAGRAGNDNAGIPARWRIPGTDITIARVEQGPRAGEYLFSTDTVKQARRIYFLARELPYQRPVPKDDLYRTAQLLTGWMIPMAWVEALPDWANTALFGMVIWKWLALLLLFGLAFCFVFLVFHWSRRSYQGGSEAPYLSRLSAPLLIIALEPLLWYLAQNQINVTGSAAQVPLYILEVVSGFAAVWCIWLVANGIAETFINSPKRSIIAGSLDASLVRLAGRSIGIIAVLVLIFRVAHDVGVPVYGLVAGAGVGGLAIALAARSSLENFMGTISLYADRPVRVGDFCRYGEDPSSNWLRIGFIEEIGLRSTRIRGIDRTITTIPNAEFANLHIVNLTHRDRMLFNTKIGLCYDTTPEQLRRVLSELYHMLKAHELIMRAPLRVRMAGFGDYSLDVELYCYVNTTDWNTFLAVQEALMIRIMEIIKQAGTAIAIPSRMLYQAHDQGSNIEVETGVQR